MKTIKTYHFICHSNFQFFVNIEMNFNFFKKTILKRKYASLKEQIQNQPESSELTYEAYSSINPVF